MSLGERIIFKTIMGLAADVKVLKKMVLGSDDTLQPISNVDRSTLASIGLPLTDKKGMDEFEEKLTKDELFKKKVVSAYSFIFLHSLLLLSCKKYIFFNCFICLFQFDTLKVFGGFRGNGNAKKLLPILGKKNFSDDFVCEISWSGKSNVKFLKKIALKKYTEIRNLIFELCYIADKQCTELACETILKDKVVKYAYRNKKVANAQDITAVMTAQDDSSNVDHDSASTSQSNSASTNQNPSTNQSNALHRGNSFQYNSSYPQNMSYYQSQPQYQYTPNEYNHYYYYPN